MNEHLAGPGRSTNLTPLTGKEAPKYDATDQNAEHLKQIETPVWDAVHEPSVVRYKVQIDYKGHAKRVATKKLESVVGSIKTASVKKRVEKDIALRQYEERYFPTKLTWWAWRLKPTRVAGARVLGPIDWKRGTNIGKGRDTIDLELPGQDGPLPLTGEPRGSTPELDSISSADTTQADTATLPSVSDETERKRILKKYKPI